MDITAIATGISNIQTAAALSTALTKKAMDTGKENAANIIQDMRAMELSVNPGLGSKFDIRV